MADNPLTMLSIHTPPMPHTKGLWIPWSQRHDPMISMLMVGPPGLEPDDAGWGSLLGQLSRAALSWMVPGIRLYAVPLS